MDLTRTRSIRLGVLFRRWGIASIGAALLFLAACPAVALVTASLRDFDWLPHVPTWLVRAELAGGNETRVRQALLELDRRRMNGDLSEAEVLALADWCLGEQSRTPVRESLARPAINLLEALTNEGAVTPDRVERFYSQACPVSVRVRPFALLHERCPMEISAAQRFPMGMYALVDVRVDESVAICDWKRTINIEFEDFRLYQYWDEFAICFARGVTPGPLSVPFDVRVRLCAGPNHGQDPKWPATSTIRDTTTRIYVPIQIAWRGPAECVQTRKSPELDAEIRSLFRSASIGLSLSTTPNGQWLYVYVHQIEPPPIGLSFLASVLAPDGRVWERGIVFHPDKRPLSSSFYVKVSEPIPEQFTVILKTDTSYARETAVLAEIWDGEIRFENVQLDRPSVSR